MPERIPQSTAIRVPLQAYLSSDHISAATGKTIAVTISKNGGAYGNPSAGATNATEIASGSYYVDLSATDTATAGPLFVLGTATATDAVVAIYDVSSIPVGVVRAGTAQAGAATTITLDSGASGTNNLYVGLVVVITGGTGAGQARTITGYNQGTKIATVDRNWTTNPSNTSTFALIAADNPALNNTLQVGNGANTIVIRTGTAQTGSTSNTIKLDSGASATNNLYSGALVQITSGTGLGQVRTIVSYVGSTKVATVDRNWVTTPDNTSAFSIVSSSTPSTFSDQGVAQAATSSTITLASTASATSSIYNGSIVTILSGTDAGDTAEITAYNGTTKVATITPNWAVTPDTTSAYAVIPVVASSGVVTGTDPLSSAVPGTYGVGTAGYVLGTNLDALVSSRLAPTVAARTLDVSATGEAGIDWANVGSPTTALGLSGTTIATATNLTNAATTGDFTSTMKTSIGTAVAASAVASVTGSVGSVTGLTTATIATAVWTDTTAGDFTTATSPGKVIFTQLGGAFTTTSSSVLSTASLANAPTGGSAPTAAAIATAVWQDTTAGDFTVASSIGKSLYTSGAVPGAAGGLFIAGTNAATTVTTAFTSTFTGNLTGSVASVAAAITLPTIPTDWITAAGLAADAVAEIQSGLSTYAGGDTSGTATLLARLTGTRAGYLDNLATAPPTAAAVATAVITTAMAESYNADGAAPTLAQALYVIMQRITDFAISGTTITVNKLDGETPAYTLTMDAAASTATSSTRAT